ncbi:hypothetical protein BHM03_00007928, partial [Ensete ventricosum]
FPFPRRLPFLSGPAFLGNRFLFPPRRLLALVVVRRAPKKEWRLGHVSWLMHEEEEKTSRPARRDSR